MVLITNQLVKPSVWCRDLNLKVISLLKQWPICWCTEVSLNIKSQGTSLRSEVLFFSLKWNWFHLEVAVSKLIYLQAWILGFNNNRHKNKWPFEGHVLLRIGSQLKLWGVTSVWPVIRSWCGGSTRKLSYALHHSSRELIQEHIKAHIKRSLD